MKNSTADAKARAAYRNYQRQYGEDAEHKNLEDYKKFVYTPGVGGLGKTSDGRVKSQIYNRTITKTKLQVVDGRVQVNLTPIHERFCTICEQWCPMSEMASGRVYYRCKRCNLACRHEGFRAHADTDHPVDREAAFIANLHGGVKGEGKAKMASWKAHVEQHGFVCAMTGIPFRVDDDDYKPSPDRIIPACKGGKYEVGNIRWVLRCVNLMLKHYDDKLFDEIARARVAKLDAERPGSSTQHAEA